MEEPLAWILGRFAAWIEIRSGRALARLRARLGGPAVEVARPPESRSAAGTWRGGVWDREMDG